MGVIVTGRLENERWGGQLVKRERECSLKIEDIQIKADKSCRQDEWYQGQT